MNIRTYLVNCISNNTNIVKERYDFEYAGVCGYSELIGWKIIFLEEKKQIRFSLQYVFLIFIVKKRLNFAIIYLKH